MDGPGELLRRLRELAGRYLGPKLGDRVAALARPGVRLAHGSGGAGRSRLGGRPVLTSGMSWPNWAGDPLSLLAVIDLAELARFGDPAWPGGGLLNFFYEAKNQEAWGFDPGEADGWRVLYTAAGGVEIPAPAGALTFPEHPVLFSRILTLPSWEEPVVKDLSETESDRLLELDDEWRQQMGYRGEWPDGDPRHQFGGWPDLVQGPFWMDAQLASHGIHVGDPDGHRDPRAPVLATGASSWRLLLQLDTDPTLDWMWADVGKLFFTIKEDDLAARSFSRTWLTLQSS